MAEITDYTEMVKERVEKAVLDSYKSLPQFQTDVAALLTSLGVTYANFNKYLNEAVAEGISADAALECYVLTLSMKS